MEDALSELDRAITELQANADSSRQLAELLNERGCQRFRAARAGGGDYGGALADFDEALRLWPGFAAALNNRACVRTQLGDYPRARADLSRARRSDEANLEARDNHQLLCRIVDLGATPALSTISRVEEGPQEDFCVALVRFLERNVAPRPGYEDCRDDAIAEVVARVLAHSQAREIDASAALRELRASTTRGWVRDLMRRFARRGSGVDVERLAAAQPARAEPERPSSSLRLDEMVELLKERLLAKSRVATRRRRRIVWDVYLRGLLDGIRLSRAEVIAAARELGLTQRQVSDHQLQRDLDVLARALRGEPGSPGKALEAKD